MLIQLRDVPRRERHLLYCTDRELVSPVLSPPRPSRTARVLAALNRSLAVHGEAIDWCGSFAEPALDGRATA